MNMRIEQQIINKRLSLMIWLQGKQKKLKIMKIFTVSVRIPRD